MTSGWIFAVAFAAGVGLCLLAFAPDYYRSPLRPLFSPEGSLVTRFRLMLRSAGIFDQAPSFVLLALGLAAAALGLVSALVIGSVYALAVGPIVVGLATYFFLTSRSRRQTKQTADALVPFIRRMEASVRAGLPTPAAYRDAVGDSAPGLRSVLEDSLSQMATGTPFIEALRSTQEKLPLKMWRLFVSQIEIHDQAGGDISKGLSATVKHIDTMVSMQKMGRAHYASFAMQQKMALLLGAVAVIFFATKLEPEMVKKMWTTPMGWIFLFFGIGLISAGIFTNQRALGKIAKRIDF